MLSILNNIMLLGLRSQDHAAVIFFFPFCFRNQPDDGYIF